MNSPERRFAPDGVERSENGRILTGEPPDSAAYCAFVARSREPLPATEQAAQEWLADLTARSEQLTDAGEREAASTRIDVLRHRLERVRRRPRLSEQFERAVRVRQGIEGSSEPVTARQVEEAIGQIEALADAAPVREQRAILSQSDALVRLLPDSGEHADKRSSNRGGTE